MTFETPTGPTERPPEPVEPPPMVQRPTLVDPLVVTRSTLRTWLISLAGIPAIVVGIDFMTRKRIVGWLTERIFPADPQTLEMRDQIWAFALIAVGVAVVAWGLKELFAPTPVLRTDDDGVHLRVKGPFRGDVVIPWASLTDVSAGSIRDDGEPVDVLVLEVSDADLLPTDPWAGRRYDETTMALFSSEWDQSAASIAHTVSEQALTVARERPDPL